NDHTIRGSQLRTNIMRLQLLLCLRIILPGVLSLSPYFCFTQNLSAGARRTPVFTDLMNGMPITRPPSRVLGDPFLSSKWNVTSISLYNVEEKIEGQQTRYNLYFDEMEYQTPEGVRVLGGSRIKSFSYKDSLASKYVNAKDYLFEGSPLVGFFEVLVDGPAPLLKKYYVLVKDPDYNPALNAGSRDTRIVRYSDLYCAKGNQVIKAKRKKDMMAFFGDKAEHMKEYMKRYSLFFGEEAHLRVIFQYYNSLLK
ncbi:MAG TPA: hypothetical protein VG737_06130, partial [Cyclobacteriaceae bacterium]|nr:hypothetical protein [Cyclobacteriaceae bacterium]